MFSNSRRRHFVPISTVTCQVSVLTKMVCVCTCVHTHTMEWVCVRLAFIQSSIWMCWTWIHQSGAACVCLDVYLFCSVYEWFQPHLHSDISIISKIQLWNTIFTTVTDEWSLIGVLCLKLCTDQADVNWLCSNVQRVFIDWPTVWQHHCPQTQSYRDYSFDSDDKSVMKSSSLSLYWWLNAN